MLVQNHEFRKGSMIKKENNNSWPWYKSSLCTKQIQICKQRKPLSMDVLDEFRSCFALFFNKTTLAFWENSSVFFIASLCGSVIIQSFFHKHRGSFRNRFKGTSNLLSFCKSFLVLKLHKNMLFKKHRNRSLVIIIWGLVQMFFFNSFVKRQVCLMFEVWHFFVKSLGTFLYHYTSQFLAALQCF